MKLEHFSLEGKKKSNHLTSRIIPCISDKVQLQYYDPDAYTLKSIR